MTAYPKCIHCGREVRVIITDARGAREGGVWVHADWIATRMHDATPEPFQRPDPQEPLF